MSHLTRTLIEDELQKIKKNNSYIFKNEAIFSLDYVPERLPYRSKQLKDMIRLFRSFFNSNGNEITYYQQIILLYGEIGSGKTVVAKRFGSYFEELAHVKLHSGIQVRYRHINCRRNRTVFTVLIQLLQSLIPYFPSRGFSSTELLRLLEQHLRDTNTYLLLALDEVDTLLLDNEFHTLLYSISRLNDEVLLPNIGIHQKRISLILITRHQKFLSFLDSSTNSSIIKNIIHFPAYSSDQLAEILMDRVADGFFPNKIDSNLIATISDLATSTGDARYALELLWRSGKEAEALKEAIILPHHIKRIQSNVMGFNKEWLRNLPVEQQIFLLTIAKQLKKQVTNNNLTLTQIKRPLILECKKWNLKIGLGNTSLWLYMKNLVAWGLLKTELASKGRRGRATLIRLDLPPNLIIQELEKSLSKL